MIRFTAFLLLIFATPAFAAETVKYAPDYCGFEVSFPEEPVSSRRCDGGDQDKCYDLIEYTKTFELSAAVRVEVICNTVDEAVYERYSPEVMEATLKAMTDKDVIKEYESSSRSEAGYKQSGLVGEGLQGITPSLFIAQLWIDKKSALSVKAELVGEEHPQADVLYSEILRSIGVKTDTPAEDADKDEDDKDQASEE